MPLELTRRAVLLGGATLAQLFTNPLVTAFDANGKPISGATLTFYKSGTTTPITIYANAMASTPLSNPLTADSAGRFAAVYLQNPSQTRAVLKDADGVTIRDTDPVGVSPYLGGLVSVLDYIPESMHASILNGTNAVSLTSYIQAAINANTALFFPAGTYLIESIVGVEVPGRYITGCGEATVIKMNGNNVRAFNITASNVTIENMLIDGSKPSVGWETTNNYDSGIRVGDGALAVVGHVRVFNVRFKDIGLDGITVENASDFWNDGCTFINCRRWGVVIANNNLGTLDCRTTNAYFNCTNGSGPSGKEYPLGAYDAEPDQVYAGITQGPVLDGFTSIRGRISMICNDPADLVKGVIRNGVIRGAADLAVANCNPVISDVYLEDGAWPSIDYFADGFPTPATITNLTMAGGNEPKIASNGRANLLPRDWLCAADGSLLVSGTGSHSYQSTMLDGQPATVSRFSVATGSGYSEADALPTTVSIVAGDIVVLVIELDRLDGNADDLGVAYLRIVYGPFDYTQAVPSKKGQRLTMIAKATTNYTNPSLLFGISGILPSTVTIQPGRSFVFVNPRRFDLGDLKAASSHTEGEVTSVSSATISPYNHDTAILNLGGTATISTINLAVGQTIAITSIGSTATYNLAGNIKLRTGTTLAATGQIFKKLANGDVRQIV